LFCFESTVSKLLVKESLFHKLLSRSPSVCFKRPSIYDTLYELAFCTPHVNQFHNWIHTHTHTRLVIW